LTACKYSLQHDLLIPAVGDTGIGAAESAQDATAAGKCHLPHAG